MPLKDADPRVAVQLGKPGLEKRERHRLLITLVDSGRHRPEELVPPGLIGDRGQQLCGRVSRPHQQFVPQVLCGRPRLLCRRYECFEGVWSSSKYIGYLAASCT